MLNTTLSRINALQDFETLHGRARWARWWNRLAGKPRTLLSFAEVQEYLPQTTPYYRGIQEIPVEEITGSVGRVGDFDRSFRPLNDGLRERWAQVKGLLETTGWEPIDVYQVGNIYFVEDGHHRVSVARSVGITSIEARIHQYPAPIDLCPQDTIQQIMARLQAACCPMIVTAVSCCEC